MAETLHAALLELVDGGGRPPCAGHADLWTSDDHTERAQAARLCQPCPLLDLCAEVADERHVRFGTWGGRDRSPRPTKARTR